MTIIVKTETELLVTSELKLERAGKYLCFKWIKKDSEITVDAGSANNSKKIYECIYEKLILFTNEYLGLYINIPALIKSCDED